MNILREKKYLGMVACGLLILGVFLPLVPGTIASGLAYFGIASNFISSWHGVVILLASLATLAIIFADKIPALASLNNQKLTLIPTGISAFIVLSNVFTLLGVGAAGIGAWLCLLGVIAAIAYPFLYKGE